MVLNASAAIHSNEKRSFSFQFFSLLNFLHSFSLLSVLVFKLLTLCSDSYFADTSACSFSLSFFYLKKETTPTKYTECLPNVLKTIYLIAHKAIVDSILFSHRKIYQV